MKLVFIDSLERGMLTAQDIFSSAGTGVPLVAKDTRLNDTMIAELRRLGIRFAYINDTPPTKRGKTQWQASSSNLYVPKPRQLVTPAVRKAAVGNLKDIFQEIQIHPDDLNSSSKVIKQLESIVGQLVDSLIDDRSALVNINDLKSYDDYTYHHSLSVAVLSIAIAHYLGFGRDDLRRLGTSAMMHDIGKTTVPIEIIHKPSRLSDAEFAIIKSHSPEGYEYLIRTALGDDDIRRGVLCHHEKVDGTGYPDNLTGDKIHFWGKIISVADVYDALTSSRPYRQPMQPGEAIEYIMGGIGKSFDYDIVHAFVKKVELYPLGSRVELSNGETGVVLNNNNSFRPVIRNTDTGEILDLYQDRQLRNVVVSRLLIEPV